MDTLKPVFKGAFLALAITGLLFFSFFAKAGTAEDDVIGCFLKANAAQAGKRWNSEMDVQIDAKAPRVHKSASGHARRIVTNTGEVHYTDKVLEGDKDVKRIAIERFFLEEGASERLCNPQDCVNQDNYTFKVKGTIQLNRKAAYVIEVTPKEKRQRLFKGEIWIDGESCVAIKRRGTLVVNPSPWITRWDFDADFVLMNGIAIPKEYRMAIQVHAIGQANVQAVYSNYKQLADDSPANALGLVFVEPERGSGGITGAALDAAQDVRGPDSSSQTQRYR